jgi:hypothetical protein
MFKGRYPYSLLWLASHDCCFDLYLFPFLICLLSFVLIRAGRIGFFTVRMSFSIARLSYRTPVLLVLLRCTALVGFSKLGVKMDVEKWLNDTDTRQKRTLQQS